MGSIAEAGASYGMLYRVSKAAVNMVAKLAHADFAPLGVRVLSLHPAAQPLAARAAELAPGMAVTLLSGPEGGLAPAEEAAALAAGFAPVTLGPRVLRAETAPLAVLGALTLRD